MSCRGGSTWISSAEENEKISLLLENFVRPALRNCIKLSSLGSGEFFVSKPLLEFYKTLSRDVYPLLRLDLLTNGTLFTKERWERLGNLKGMVDDVSLSIDAAEKETYEKLRLGGCWDALCKNIEYISSLKSSGEIHTFSTGFVVRDENFRQMKDFVTLSKNWGADRVTFQRIKNYGHFSSDFNIMEDVFAPENPLYEEAVQMLVRCKEETGIEVVDNCLCTG